MPNNTRLKFTMVVKRSGDEIVTVEGVLTLGPKQENDKEVLALLFTMERTLNQGLADARVHISLDELPFDGSVQ